MADADMRITVTGARETLREIKTLDIELRRQTWKSMRSASKPMLNAARGLVPASPPMRNWRTVEATRGRTRGGAGWPAWDAPSKGVKVKIGGRARRNDRTWPLLRLTQADAAGAIYDMAGRKSSGNGPQGVAFINNLNRIRSASRSIWPAAEQHSDDVQRGVLEALAVAEAHIQRRID